MKNTSLPSGASMSEDERRPFDLIPLHKVKRRAVPWLWPSWVPANGVTLLPGDPKLAKSTLALDWAARLSRGEIGDPDRAPTSIVVTGEDPVAEVVEPRVAAAGGELCHVHVLDVTDPEAVFTLPEHIPDLEQRIYEIGAQLTIIDPLNRFLAETVDGHKDQSIRRAMGPLHEVAERQRCAIVVVAHLNKAMSANPLYRVGGSIGLTGAARSVLLFAKDPEDLEGERGRYRILAQAGSNYGQQQPSRRYVIEPTLLPADDDVPVVETIRLVDEGEVEIAASDLLATPSSEERGALDEACHFLRGELTNGPEPAEEVRKRARNARIADRTLDRAREKLGVHASRTGGIGSAGHWEWSLRTPKGVGAPSDGDVGALSENRSRMGDPGRSEPLRLPTADSGDLSRENGRGCPTHRDAPVPGCRYCRGDRG
jgi:AAA domain